MKRARQRKKDISSADVIQLELPLFDTPGADRSTSDSSDGFVPNHVQNAHIHADESPASQIVLDSGLPLSTPALGEIANSVADASAMLAVANTPAQDVFDTTMPEIQNTILSLKEAMTCLLADLSERERDILKLRFGLDGDKPWKLEEIGKRIGVTRERVRQIEGKILRALHHPRYHRVLQPITLVLEQALERSQGVISCFAAQQLIAVNDDYDPRMFEVTLAFALQFTYTIEKIENVPVITFSREPYNTFIPYTADIFAIFRHILARAHERLSADEILVRFVTDNKGKDIWRQVSETFLLACLNAHPEITVDEQGAYHLKRRAITDEPRAYLLAVENAPNPVTSDQLFRIEQIATPVDRAIEPALRPLRPNPPTRPALTVTSLARAPDAYDVWNHALIAYFTEGVQRGTAVFLSVDDDAIAQIEQNLRSTNTSDLENFDQAVRNRVIRAGCLNLNMIRGRNEQGEPQGVAFLAAMVLAASWMDNEEGISHLDYFNRLRAVLDLPLEDGRPRGMHPGAEEPLWREWVLWLQEQGFLPSAYRGKEGAQKYIAYPISQALLRGVDKERLCRLFADKHWLDDWDAETLFARVRREADTFSKHLQSVLSSPERFQALAEAIHEVYESWQDALQSGRVISGAAHSPHLFAWLYRTEDSGAIAYYLYPRSSRKQHIDQIQVLFGGTSRMCGIDRPGWYMPIGPINETDLDNGGHYTIEQPADLDVLILRQRQFWVLKPDPENPTSGVYTSWGRLELGTPFILLCRQELIPQLKQLQNKLLIEWNDEQRPFVGENWIELQHCMIRSWDWSGITIESKELYDELQPSISVSISTAGGLHVPEVGGWLEGYGPRITIFGSQTQADVCIIRDADECVVMEQAHDTNTPFNIEWPGSGDYRIEAACAGEHAGRLVKIIPWEHLRLAAPEYGEVFNIGDWCVRGAAIEHIG